MKKKRKTIDCIEYLSVEAPIEKVTYLENKQSRYIHEYARNKEYSIVGCIRRNGFSQRDVNRQWNEIVELIRLKKVDGVILSNIQTVAISIPEAYKKIGEIVAVGGIIVTVDDGLLGMSNLKFETEDK